MITMHTDTHSLYLPLFLSLFAPLSIVRLLLRHVILTLAYRQIMSLDNNVTFLRLPLIAQEIPLSSCSHVFAINLLVATRFHAVTSFIDRVCHAAPGLRQGLSWGLSALACLLALGGHQQGGVGRGKLGCIGSVRPDYKPHYKPHTCTLQMHITISHIIKSEANLFQPLW